MKKAEFNTFLGSLPDAALLFSEEGAIVHASAMATKLLESSLTELTRKSIFSLLEQKQEEEEEERSSWKLEAKPQIWRLNNSKGETFFVDATLSSVEVDGESLRLALLREREDDEESGRADNVRHHMAVDTWNVGIYEHDHLTDEIYGCPKVRELYCLADNERLTIEVFAGSLHPDDFDRAIGEIMKAHNPEGDGKFDVFHRIVPADGAIRWIHTRAKTTFGLVNGKIAPVLTTGSIMDMTSQQEMRLELEKNEERLMMATVAAEVGILEIEYDAAGKNEGGEKVYWSPSLRSLAGIEEGLEPSFDWYFEHIHPADLADVQAALSIALDPSRRGNHEVEHRFIRPDGKMCWMSVRATTIFDGEGGDALPLRIIGVVLDVSERKAAEEDRARRTAILDATPDFVCITDTEGVITYLNRSGRRLLGLDEHADLFERTMGPVHPPEVLKKITEEGIPAARRDGSWTGETAFLRHDGVAIPMSQVLLVHRNDKGEVVFFSTIARDLSRERELEDQFRQAQKMEAVGRLAGGIAHDFNNLLSVIMGFAEIAEDRMKKGKGGSEELEEIQRAAKRAASLTEQLLAFSRKQILNPQAIDLGEVVVSVLPMLQRLLDESIELCLVPAKKGLRTKADPHQVEQILLNLVVNARDAMPGGGRLTIEVSHAALDDEQAASRLDLEPGTYVVLAVSDNGHGMDAEIQEKIFEPFFTTKEPGKGTGLGLSTVFGIVRQSGGGIWVYSEPDLGTTFKIYFPCTKEEPVRRDSLAPALIHPAIGVILLTEDEPQLRQLLTAVLSNAGYTVLSAAEPIEALGLAEDFQGVIDLLLTDVVMPNMSGRKLADELLKKRPSTQVLYMSGYTEDSIVHHGVLDEGIEFIPKPITPKALLTRLAELLESKAEASQ